MKSLIIGVMLAATIAGAEEKPTSSYESYENCRRKVLVPRPPSTGTTSWLTYSSARGAGRYTTYGFWVYCYNGQLFAHYYPSIKFNTVGSVLALPLGDFAVMESYDVNLKGRNGVTTKGTTKKVAVNVHISYPSATKPPPEFACQRMVENLVNSGMNIPSSMGKPCRIMPLKQTAMMRFGAKRCYPDYSLSEMGTVILLLEDCDSKRAKPYIVPAIASGQSGSAYAVANDGIRFENQENRINEGYTSAELYELIRAHHKHLMW